LSSQLTENSEQDWVNGSYDSLCAVEESLRVQLKIVSKQLNLHKTELTWLYLMVVNSFGDQSDLPIQRIVYGVLICSLMTKLTLNDVISPH